MLFISARWFSAAPTALAAVTLLSSCAVGPDFRAPAAPEITRYTREPLASRTSAADATGGQPQQFEPGRDIPQQWWTLFKSPALNALIEQSLQNNPTLQSAMATLRASQAGGLRAGGQVLSARPGQLQSDPAADFRCACRRFPSSNASIFDLDTAQVAGLVHFRRLGPQSAHGGIAPGDGRHATLPGRGRLPDADREHSRRRDHRSLLARPDRRHQRVDRDQHQNARYPAASIECRLRQSQRRGGARSRAWPKRKRRCRRCARRCTGARPNCGARRRLTPAQEPRETFHLADLHLPADLAGEPAVAIDRAAAGRARGGGATAFGERTDRRRHRQYSCRTSPSAPMPAS